MLMPKRLSAATARTAAAGSWVALVAATTLGDTAHAVRAEIRADGLSEGGVYRLVVQSYDAVPGGERASRYSRPVGSVQRSVTSDELRDGVHVSVLELREKLERGTGTPHILAWVEAGEPDLEFDGRMARPQPGSVYGVVRRSPGRSVVQVSLNRKVSA